MGLTWLQRAPFRSISGPSQGSGRGRLQELIWSAWGCRLGLPGGSSVVELELMFSRSELVCVFTAPLLVRGEPENATI